MFSQTVEYALRAVVFLATKDTPSTNTQIAETTKVPSHYLSKVLQSLGRSRIVHSQRGVHGGFTLEKDPAELSILDVINAVDPIRRIETCPLGLKQHGTTLCPLHKQIDQAIETIEATLSNQSIADLLATASPSQPLCESDGKAGVNLTIGKT